MSADYRKMNDKTHNSSTYHKKDGTPVRAKLKEQLLKELKKESDWAQMKDNVQ